MVSRSVSQGTTIIPEGEETRVNAKKEKILFSILILTLIAMAVVIGWFAVEMFNKNTETDFEPGTLARDDVSDEESAEESPENIEVEAQKIDFQPIIDEWVASVGGNKSVIIYDLDRDEQVGAFNLGENYNTASLYKLFVVYEGYRRVQSGEWKAEDIVGSTSYTVLECLDLAVRESYSPCAESLWARIGHRKLDEIIQNDFKITGSNISGLVSNVEDILKMMKIFYEHNEINDENLILRMKDSFLNQPVTEYDWRQGLPSGFSPKANIYNKVGWDYDSDKSRWNIYHDAAIIEFPEDNRHFIVVVMTNYVSNRDIARLGTMIENQYVLKN